jgi:hypothetical protein
MRSLTPQQAARNAFAVPVHRCDLPHLKGLLFSCPSDSDFCGLISFLSSPEGLWGLENHMLQDEPQKIDRDRLIFRLVGQNLELFYTLLVDKLDNVGCSGLC